MPLRKYVNDYQTVSTVDENGREKQSLVYKGPYFETSLDPAGLLRLRRVSLLLLLLIIALHVGGGFVDNPGMYMFYVSLPYVITFFPLVYLASGILRLPKEVRKYRRDEVGLSFDQVRKSSRTLLIILGVGILGELFYVIIFGKSLQLLSEIIYLGIEGCALLSAYMIVKSQKAVMVQTSSED
jgi:hypothetical protein